MRKSFTLDDAASVTSYLDDLGVSHVYLSPVLEARPDSNHGYDAIDVTKISDERGGDAGFAKLAAQVSKAKNIQGLLLDIVPNHVAANWRNPAWWDVLKEGQNSKHWATFDIRARGASDMRVVLPVLGRSRQAILASRELHLGLLNGELVFKYYDNFFPVSSVSYSRILHALAAGLNDDSKRAVKWKKQLSTFAQESIGKNGSGQGCWRICKVGEQRPSCGARSRSHPSHASAEVCHGGARRAELRPRRLERRKPRSELPPLL